MQNEIKPFFQRLISNSLNTDQVRYLGERLDKNFDLHRESGIPDRIPIPTQDAARILIKRFGNDEDIVELFTELLQNEGKRFYNATLRIWEKEKFIAILEYHKWVFDPDLQQFFLDPFYEHPINLLKKLKVIDLRSAVAVNEILATVSEATKNLGIQELEWRITVRLYDIEASTGSLLRKIIEILLMRQDLKFFMHELFTCIKELAINASKANYKLLFEKNITRPLGITADGDYAEFLRLFKEEIDENGNRRLIDLARKEDRFITIIFQSTRDSISVWVTNNANISAVEKQQIMARVRPGKRGRDDDSWGYEYAEGAGLGLNLILAILQKYTTTPDPLKIVFYPDFIKVGFELPRNDIELHRPQPEKS